MKQSTSLQRKRVVGEKARPQRREASSLPSSGMSREKIALRPSPRHLPAHHVERIGPGILAAARRSSRPHPSTRSAPRRRRHRRARSQRCCSSRSRLDESRARRARRRERARARADRVRAIAAARASPIAPPAQPRPKIGRRCTVRRRFIRSISSASKLGVAMPVVDTATTASISLRVPSGSLEHARVLRARADRAPSQDRLGCAPATRAAARTTRSARTNSGARCRCCRTWEADERFRASAGRARDRCAASLRFGRARTAARPSRRRGYARAALMRRRSVPAGRVPAARMVMPYLPCRLDLSLRRY